MGALRTYFENLRNLPISALKTAWFDYHTNRIADLTSRVWGARRGVFGSATPVAAGADRFSLTTLPLTLLDGDGEILDLLAGTDATAIRFENALGVPYYVGARRCLVPSGVLRSRRVDSCFYDALEERVGEVAEPDSVAEVGDHLEVVVDAVFEAGVDHSGRLVTVWLRRPLTTDEAVAVERDLVVTYVGGHNVVSTVGLLGQGAGAVEADPTFYQVCAQGVTVRRNTDLRATTPYAYLCWVDGAGAGNPPVSFSVADQVDVSGGTTPSLQTAYEGDRSIATSAAHGGAVKVSSSASGDALRSVLHLDRRGATETTPVGLVSVAEHDDGVAFLALHPYLYAGGLVEETEPGTSAAAGLVNLTRGGALHLVNGKVSTQCDLALLSGFATAAMNRLFRVSVVAAAAVTLIELEGGVPAGWAAGESGSVEFLRIRAVVGEEAALGGAEGGKATTLNGQTGDDRVLAVYPRGATYVLELYDGTATPVLRFQVNATGILEMLNNAQILVTSGVIELGASGSVHGATADGGIQVAPGKFSAISGVTGSVGYEFAQSHKAAGAGFEGLCDAIDDPPFPPGAGHFLRFEDWKHRKLLRFTPDGRLIRPHCFADDFMEHAVTAALPPPYRADGSGNTWIYNPGNGLYNVPGGVLQLVANGTPGWHNLTGPQAFGVKPAGAGDVYGGSEYQVGFHARMNLNPTTNVTFLAGIRSQNAPATDAMRIGDAGSGSFIGLMYTGGVLEICQTLDNVVKISHALAGFAPAANGWFDVVVLVDLGAAVGDELVVWATGMADFHKFALDPLDCYNVYAPTVEQRTTVATPHVLNLDFWEVWDANLLELKP